MQKLLEKIDWSVEDVDLWEINEAFAVVTMAAQKDLGIDMDKINIMAALVRWATQLAHQVLAFWVTLLHALEHTSKKRGVASLCIGGGEATAMAIEIA